jgi:hypothetical protein
MADTPGTLELVARHLTLALRPLVDGVSDLPHFKQLMYRLGWSVADLPPEYQTLSAAVKAAVAKLDTLGDSPSADDIAELLRDAKQVYDAIQGIAAAPPGVDAAAFLSEVRERLPELLLTDYLALELPALYRVLLMLNVIRVEHQAATANRPSFVRVRLDWSQIPFVLGHPQELPAIVYGWGTPDLNVQRIVDHLAELLFAFGLPVNIEAPDSALAATYAGLDDDAGLIAATSLVVPFWFGKVAGQPVQLAVAVRELPGTATALPGLVVEPQIPAQLPLAFPLSDTLALRLTAGTNAGSQVGILIRPDDVSIKYPFAPGTPPPQAGIGVGLDFKLAATTVLLGSAGATRLELKSASLDLAAQSTNGELDVVLGAETDGLAFVLAAKDLDGFLGELLGRSDRTIPIALGVRWSNRTGFNFTGGAGFAVSTHPHLSLGPVRIERLDLAAKPAADSGSSPSVTLQVGAALSATIGPVTAAADGIGVSLALVFADGNAGPFDLDVGFMAPSGFGLAVDAHAVTGGGFLFHDPAQGSYAGVMQLSFRDELTLTAYGIIATRMPDGGEGYSLLIFITAEGFEPVPLGFGFQLEAIGGLLGVHRTFDQEVLKAGLKNDTLATLLFPRDPVANAPALIQALAAAFPPRQGSYLLGLMARITWFTPTLVTLDLALVLELGARTRLLALGRVSALLPSPDNDLIRLNLDAMGVLDFDAGTLACDAVLVDSRLAHQFPITGSAALRAAWPGGGGSPTTAGFVLAVGGLNPRFAAPAAFPPLERVAIALCSGDNPRLVCDAYLAVTANTVQFGARTSLYAAALGFSVAGDLGFDALVELLPPHFIVDFHASVQLKRGSHNLFKVTLDGTLEGPLPLRLAAKATFELLWMSFSVHFDFTLSPGDLAEAALPAVDLAAELVRAVADPGSWSTRRPPGLGHGVVLRALPPGPGLVLDPLGQLVVRQQVAPLNAGRDVDTYGGNPVAGPRRFHLAATLQGAAAVAVPGAFAPARYFAMSDDEKLAAPSFEAMDAGLVLGDGGASFDPATVVAAPLAYESIVLGPASAPAAAPAEPQRYDLPAGALSAQRGTGAAARTPARQAGAARFRNAAGRPAATLAAPRWRLVHASDGAVAPEDPALTTWSEHRAALAALNRGGARWLLVPAHELQPSP